MDWAEIWKNTPAVVSVAKDLILAGVAVSGAVVGWKALTKWREEAVGKRRLEVAEEALLAFYQMQEIISDVRAPIIWAGEMVPEDGVPEDVTQHSAYGPIRRLKRSMDAIRDWRTKRHRFAAYFGPNTTTPWAKIEQVLNSMDAASFTLLSARHERGGERAEYASFYDKQRRILARGLEDDEIAAQVAAAVTEIEAICQPIIQASVKVRTRV